MQNTLRREILERHKNSLHGRLRACRIYSRHLCHVKSLYVYEPPGIRDLKNIPVVYLFRGHEREWVNMQEDNSRKASTAIEDIDFLISQNVLPPLVAVMPGLNSNNNHIPSLGIDMQGSWPIQQYGLGTGRFWKYMSKEVIPWTERKYPRTSALRMAVGFSLGGFTAGLLGTRYPGYFDHIGVYDGLFMWADHKDPRVTPVEAFNDRVWLQNTLFDATFGSPRKKAALRKWNPSETLERASPGQREILRQTTWWIHSASDDGNKGNKDRCRYFIELLDKIQIPLGFDDLVFAPDAAHNWHWTDRFLIHFLQRVLA